VEAGGPTAQETSVIKTVPVTVIRRRILLVSLFCRWVILHDAEGVALGIFADGIITENIRVELNRSLRIIDRDFNRTSN
jgi:hypothetical protein